MPLIEPSTYSPPRGLGNCHRQTVYPTLFRKVAPVAYERVRIELPDSDFLDLDYASVGGEFAVVLCHGLESSSDAKYMRGMAHLLNAQGYDAIAMNFRGCSGEPNRLVRSYHSGATEDLRAVLQHVLLTQKYSQIALIGFSLGGNLILKYLGEGEVVSEITGAVTISVPCDLRSSALRLAEGANRIYMRRFMQGLYQKILSKNKLCGAQFDEAFFKKMTTFAEFDEHYTAAAHGFASAEDYWTRCSSRPFIPQIETPTLLINSLDDPFLAPECFPREEALQNPKFFFETPSQGGHVGFVTKSNDNTYWHEKRAVEFLANYLS